MPPVDPNELDPQGPEHFARRRAAAAAPQRAQSRADLSAAASVLTEAFADDPPLSYALRDDARRPQARRKFFDLLCGLGARHGEVWLARDGDRPLAASIWAPPPGAVTTGFIEEITIAHKLIGCAGLGRINRFLKLRAAMDTHHPKAAHWYLMFLGVAPAFKGQGLGGALLNAKLEAIDAAGDASYLENSNPRNFGLYSRAGFEAKAAFRPEPTGPELTAMWRDARSS
jgi:ribosomal protein S18 acetylase RimI-like enzyme